MITIRNAAMTATPSWGTRKDGSHVLNVPFVLLISADYRKCRADLVFTFRDGFRCDGLSVPWAFRWFLKSWDEKSALYNVAGAVHDWLYSSEGGDRLLTREECDDVFRGLLRESGIGRFKAGCADKAVEWFAGGNKHWGNDSYKVRDRVTFNLRVG